MWLESPDSETKIGFANIPMHVSNPIVINTQQVDAL